MGTTGSDVFDLFSETYASNAREEMSLQEYLLACREDRSLYATAPERMVAAIGEPQLIDTSADERLGRIFANRTIKIYPSFSDFYGMEDTVERIVGYFRYAAQGLEERKQILYLLGPVGGGKSSLAERLKKLMEEQPIYTLAIDGKVSPVFESPLGLFSRERMGDLLEEKYGIAKRRLTGLISPWATKRLDEIDGDISRFSVVKLMPSRLRQIAIAKTEPGDENNQDVSALVGKVDIRQLENFSQADPDAYSYSGGLNRTTQGLLEFVEMFKAPIKVLHPLLTATQEGSYNGTENFGGFPYQGIVLAHSNESEWLQFKHNKNNEAFLDRILVVKVPYYLRVTEERLIYEKLLRESELSDSPCAPEVLENLSRFTVATRLSPHENSPTYTKMRVYDGENLKDTDPKAKSLQEYRDAAGIDEGMTGVSTRFAFKVLSETFNYDTKEVAADPVHLMYILEQAIRREQFPKEVEANYIDFIRSELAARYGALSADHLEYTDDAGAAAMAKAGTVAVILPGAFYFIRETKKPPVDLFRKHGVKMAVATDSNPGTSPLTSLLLTMNMAATLFGMTVEECIAGTTREAARALGLVDEVGTLEAGKWADFVLWDIGRPAELVYRMGFNPMHARIRSGH